MLKHFQGLGCALTKRAITMPLVLMCGYPSSGKSTRAKELQDYLKKEYPTKAVVYITDSSFSGFSKLDTFSDPTAEKNLRSYLKSEAQKLLNKDTVVILDSSNYIKGYRYELFCVTKSAQTPHLLIWTDISKDGAMTLNSVRPESEKYPETIINELIMRFEEPIDRNRWDSPLYVVQKDDPFPAKAIASSIFHNKAAQPNLSTVAQPLQPTNFLYELDKRTLEILKDIVAVQKSSVVVGEKLTLSSGDVVQLSRHCTLAELNKIRRQFITFIKMNPLTDSTRIPQVFLSYLQKAVN